MISHDWGNKAEILRVTRWDCKGLLLHHSKEYLELTEMYLYKIYILLVLLYGCEISIITNTLAERLNAFDTCLVSAKNLADSIHWAQYKWESPDRLLTCPRMGQVPPVEVLRTPGSLGTRGRPIPCYCHCTLTTDWLQEIHWIPRSIWLRTIIDEYAQLQNFGSTQHGGRQGTGMFGTRLVWQLSVRSFPLRRSLGTGQYCNCYDQYCLD